MQKLNGNSGRWIEEALNRFPVKSNESHSVFDTHLLIRAREVRTAESTLHVAAFLKIKNHDQLVLCPLFIASFLTKPFTIH